ncbi:MAG: hypothetical protein QOG41_1778, partial [Thermoleophilaceae bacterium]|nr:hypothetical protein [Thermoleophilaceae bacterium]
MQHRKHFVMAAVVLAVAVAAPARAATGNIFTVAGTGAHSFSGEGGPATSAALSGPIAVKLLADGSYLISDQGNHRIRRVGLDGKITTVAGNGDCTAPCFGGDGGPATSAQLHFPGGVAPIPGGGFYIADSYNNRVRKVGTDGTITTVAGNGTTTFGGDGGPATSASLDFPTDVVVLPDGGYLIADNVHQRVREVGTDGKISTVAGNGTAASTGNGGAATAASVNGPKALALTPDGGFLVAEEDGNYVRKVGTDGKISTVAGDGTFASTGDGGPATAAAIDGPAGLAAMPDGGFVVSERYGNRVRRVTPDGKISTLAGTGAATYNGDDIPATTAALAAPFGLDVTPEGDVLIADTGNNRIRLVDSGDATQPPPDGRPDVTSIESFHGDLTAGRISYIAALINRPAKRLDWDVTGDGKTDVSRGPGQNGLAFRPPGGGALSKATIKKLSARALGDKGFGDLFTTHLTVKPASQPTGIAPSKAKTLGDLTNAKPVFVCAKRTDLDKGVFQGGDFQRQLHKAQCISATEVAGPLRVTGCLHQIDSPKDIPTRERDALETLFEQRLGIPKGSYEAALALTDGLISDGVVTVNGMRVLPGNPQAVVVLHKQLESIVSSDAQLSVGGIELGHRPDFRIDTLGRTRVPLGSFPRVGGPGTLGSFGFDGDLDVTLVGDPGLDAHADVLTHLKLPDWLGGFPAQATVRVNPNGYFALDTLSLGPTSFGVAGIGIDDLKIDYDNGSWRGGMRLCVFPGACLDARPRPGVLPEPGVEINSDGSFRVYANVTFPDPGLQLFTGVFLNSVGAGLAEPPLRFLGGAALHAAGIFAAQGGLVLAFPSSAAPYRLEADRSTVGNGFDPKDYPVERKTFTLAAGGTASVDVFGLDVPLGNGHVLYQYPGYVSFGGGIDKSFFGVIKIIGITSGA